jgi:methyl-accepting chemotaxis protein
VRDNRPARSLRRASLGRRLYGGFAALVALLLVTSALGVLALDKLAARTRNITEVSDPKERAAADVRFAIGEVYGFEIAYVLGDRDSMRGAYQQAFERLAQHLAVLRATSTTAVELESVTQLDKHLVSFRENDEQVWAASDAGDQSQAISALQANQRPLYASMIGRVNQYVSMARDSQAEDVRAFDETRSRSKTLMLLLGPLTILVAGLTAWLITRSITRPVLRAVQVLETVAGGDLRPRLQVSSRDEIGRMGNALNMTLERVRTVFGSIVASAESLASAAGELTAVSHQMASSAEETSAQALSVSSAAEQVSGDVQVVAAATDEMTGSIREVSEQAARAADVATQGTELADQATSTVERLGDASRQIGDIVAVISSIAEQTSLLALNATIEAARAGEAGRGFAVVAHEVKELSQATSAASSDITGRIQALQGSAGDAAESIEAIAEIIRRVNESQVTIASAVEEQTATTNSIGGSVTNAAAGTAEIARAMVGVAQAAHSTTSGASDTQRAAGDLAAMAASLRQLVDEFQV